VTKKKKIVLISVAVTLALALGVGGLIQAFDHEHMELGGHKLIGVGEMGYYDFGYLGQHQCWDTQLIITNPNCERYLDIEWVALIAGEHVCWRDDAPCWEAEDVIFEGTPEDWYIEYGIEIPGELSPHDVWQVSIAEIMGEVMEEGQPEKVPCVYAPLGKYTLEVTWSGVPYTLWFGWRGRPLIGWQKEKCWSQFTDGTQDFTISEAEMQLFPNRTGFKPPEI